MLPGMRNMPKLLVLLITFCAATAHAEDSPQITTTEPSKGLPAISTDGKSFVRPVLVQPKGCSGIQTFAEIGTVGTPSADPKSELVLVRDECKATSVDKNLDKVNATLKAKAYRSTGSMATMTLPTTIAAPSTSLRVSATGKTVDVSVDGSSADKWSVKLEGTVGEVRGWYAGTSATGAAYVSIQVSAHADDTGTRGRERWLDFWPVGSAISGDGETPVEIAAQLLAALKAKDAKAIAAVTSTPFWKAGLTPVSGKQAKKCKKLQRAKTGKQLRGVAACMALAGTLYGRFAIDASTLAEIDMTEFPAELKKHKKKIAKLLKANHKMVRYFVNDQGYYLNLVFVLDPDTDYQTVVVVLESVELEDE